MHINVLSNSYNDHERARDTKGQEMKQKMDKFGITNSNVVDVVKRLEARVE